MTITKLQQKTKRVLRELVSKENNHEIWCILSTLLYFQQSGIIFQLIQISDIIILHTTYLLCKYNDVAYYEDSYVVIHFLRLSRFHRSFKIFGAKKLRIVAKCYSNAMTSLLIIVLLLMPYSWSHAFISVTHF